MPLEGLTPAGQLIPKNQLAEAQNLGAFEAKVETNEMLKKVSDEDGANKHPGAGGEEEENQETAFVEELSEMAEQMLTKEDEELPSKNIEYTLKFNQYTELVELIDLKTGNMVQAVPPSVLIGMVSDLKFTSGVFVDNEI